MTQADNMSGGPFAEYPALTEVCTAAAQAQIIASLNAILALIPDQTAQQKAGGEDGFVTSAGHPDFDLLPTHMRNLLRAEINGAITDIDAMPVA